MNKVMKKFKLIKKYPGSPELGDIWPENTIVKSITAHPNGEGGGEQLEEEDKISDYSEFWEEITQKPLFNTEDGIDIHHGDSYWLMVSGRAHCLIASQYETFDTSGIIKRYSSKEAACCHIKAFSISDLEKLHHHGWKHLNQMKVDLLNSFK